MHDCHNTHRVVRVFTLIFALIIYAHIHTNKSAKYSHIFIDNSLAEVIRK